MKAGLCSIQSTRFGRQSPTVQSSPTPIMDMRAAHGLLAISADFRKWGEKRVEEIADIHVLNAKGVSSAIAEYEYVLPEGPTRKGYIGDLRIFY